MVSTGKNLDKDELKSEMQDLAAKTLQNKNINIKKVTIEAKLETKTTRTGADRPKSEAGSRQGSNGSGEKPGAKKDFSARNEGKKGEKSGQESKAGEKDEESGKKESNQQAPDKKGQDGKQSAEANQPKGESGGEAGKQADGGSGEDKEKPESEPNKEKPGESNQSKEEPEAEKSKAKDEEGKSKEQSAGGGKADKEGGEKGEKAGEKKPEEESGQKSDKGEEKKNQTEEKPKAKKDFQPGGGPSAGSGQGEEAPDGAAGKLREEKRGDEMTNTAFNMVDASGQRGKMGETGSAGDWASAVRQAAKIKRQAQNLKEAKGKLKQAVAAPINQATSKLLQQAWINLLDSFGLTLIWINIHVFLRFVVGEELFCKLGREWLPKQVTQAGSSAGSELGGEATETAGKGIGLLEVMVFLILDFIVLMVIFVILALIYMIVDFMQAGYWKKAEMTIGYLSGLGWGGIKAFYDLFAK